MYFSIGLHPDIRLNHHVKINNMWLSTINADKFYGYKLGTHGGNFLEITNTGINFSYHKDSELYFNENVYITNLEIEGTQHPSDIVSFDFGSTTCTRYKYSTAQLNYETAKSLVYAILLENILQTKHYKHKIAYTAGLDSSTLAYIAHANNIDFTCLIRTKLKDKLLNLPFSDIQYHEITMPEFAYYGTGKHVQHGFYQPENNNTVTGYYGDLTVTHNGDMFEQARDLYISDNDIKLYDPTVLKYDKFNSMDDMRHAIKYINTNFYFKHWFENFQIIDPYRDPRLVEVILSMNDTDMIEQVGTGKIQKDIIKSLNSEWLNNLCEYKNNYEKF